MCNEAFGFEAPDDGRYSVEMRLWLGVQFEQVAYEHGAVLPQQAHEFFLFVGQLVFRCRFSHNYLIRYMAKITTISEVETDFQDFNLN